MAVEHNLADSISFSCITGDSGSLTVNVVTFSNAISDMQSQFQSLTSLHGRNPYVVFADEENALLLKDCFHKLGLRLPSFLFRVHLLYQEFSLFSKRCSITYPVENSMDFVLRVCNAREPALRGLQRCLDIQEALQSLFQKGHSLSPSTLFLLSSQSTQDNICLRSPGFSPHHSSLGNPSDLPFSLQQSTPAELFPEIGTTPSTLLSRQSDSREDDLPHRHFSLDASTSPLSRPRYARTPTLSMELRRTLPSDSHPLHEGYSHFRGTHSQTPLLHASPFRDRRGVGLGEGEDEFMPELQLSRGQESYLGSTLFTFHERPVVSASPALTSLPTRSASALGGSDTRSFSLSSTTTTTTVGTSLWSEPLGSMKGESLFAPPLLGSTSHPVGQGSIDSTLSHSSTRGIFHHPSPPHTLPAPSELGLSMRMGGVNGMSSSGISLSRGLSADSNGGGRRRSHSLSAMSSSTSTTPSATAGITTAIATGGNGSGGVGSRNSSAVFPSTGAGVSNGVDTSSTAAFRYGPSSPLRYQTFTPTFPSTTRGSHGLLDNGLEYSFARGSPMSHFDLDVDVDLAGTASGSEMSGFELSRGSVDVRLSSDFQLEDGLGTFSSSFDYTGGGGGGVKGSRRGGITGSTLNPHSAEFIPGRASMATNGNGNGNGNNEMTSTATATATNMFSGTELTTNDIISASASSSGIISAADSPSSPPGVIGMNEINRPANPAVVIPTPTPTSTSTSMQFVGNGYEQVNYGLHYPGVHMNHMPSTGQSDHSYVYYNYYNGMPMNTTNPTLTTTSATSTSTSTTSSTMTSANPNGMSGSGGMGGQSRDKRSRDLLVRL